MYTSDKEIRVRTTKTALIYLAASIFCAVFGAVYELFSHGVYSYFMIYAFAFPLLGGVLPFLLLSYFAQRHTRTYQESKIPSRFMPNTYARNTYHCGIIALTVGSLLTGVLEIYGTTNALLSIYWLAGSALMLVGIVIYLLSLIIPSRQKVRNHIQ